MLDALQNNFNDSVKNMAENNLIKKLNAKGIDRAHLSSAEYEELLRLEIDILKSDGKKFGAGLGVGIALSILTGGLFW